MKIHLGSILILAIVLAFCSSCQKNPGTSSPNPQPDSLYAITQLTVLDTLYNSGDDTSHNALLFYDQQKRIQRIMAFSDGLGANRPSPYNLVAEYTLFYEGVDILPKMIRRKGWNGFDYPNGVSYSDSLYIFYNNGIVVKDSLVRFRFETKRRVRRFSPISATRCLLIEKDMHYMGLSVDTISNRIVNLKWSNNNFTEFADTIFNVGGNASINYLKTFDNNLNPFKRIAIPYPIDIITYLKNLNVTFSMNSLLCLPSLNNLSSTQNLGSSQTHITIAYDYNKEGFPVISRSNFTNQGPQTPRLKSIYKYTKI